MAAAIRTVPSSTSAGAASVCGGPGHAGYFGEPRRRAFGPPGSPVMPSRRACAGEASVRWACWWGGSVDGEVPGDASGLPAGVTAGSRLAGYLLEEQVGEGGMAVVFRAWDERLGRRVALKVLAPALAADAEFRDRFMRESQAAAAVDDPHIIPVFEAGEAGGVLFIAMRYVPGGDVRTLVRAAGPLPPGRAAAIISAGGLGAGRRARGRAGAPRREAGQHADGRAGRAARSRVPVGFRAEQGCAVGRRPDPHRAVPGHAGLRRAGAARGPAGRRAGGSVCAGVRGVRAAEPGRRRSIARTRWR